MAFTAKILSWRFRHLNIVGCFLKRRPAKGGSRAPQDPPSYAPGLAMGYHYCYHKIRSTVKLTEYDNYGNKILFAYRHAH